MWLYKSKDWSISFKQPATKFIIVLGANCLRVMCQCFGLLGDDHFDTILICFKSGKSNLEVCQGTLVDQSFSHQKSTQWSIRVIWHIHSALQVCFQINICVIPIKNLDESITRIIQENEVTKEKIFDHVFLKL